MRLLSGALQPTPRSVASAQRGQVDEAFEYCEHQIALRAPQAYQILMDPTLAPLRSDPRFAEIKRKLGFA